MIFCCSSQDLEDLLQKVPIDLKAEALRKTAKAKRGREHKAT